MKTDSPRSEFDQHYEIANNPETFHFFLSNIQHVYWAENIQLKTFSKWALLVNSQELRKSVLDYMLVTAGQVQHIEHIFEILAQKTKGKIDTTLSDLIRDIEIITENTKTAASAADSVIVKALCEIASYQIEVYEKLNSLAKRLKHYKISELIEKTLKEEHEIFRYFQNFGTRLTNS
ncbi:DUF892 family protein [Dyadobacter sp. CY345]|uniref:DUF892 family protein n=1 Tax=Dyadobacter sp. CY345 TaxID=2909335 RepID=UPI001F1CD98A|nr:DUF892 family protein [Dyadobacter sp. CY345]MCF2447731.1 DUF892 family protein [Dyadobacter sp. CY345]